MVGAAFEPWVIDGVDGLCLTSFFENIFLEVEFWDCVVFTRRGSIGSVSERSVIGRTIEPIDQFPFDFPLSRVIGSCRGIARILPIR